MGKVYVVQEAWFRKADGTKYPHDMSPALEFGSLEVLLPPHEQYSALNSRRLARDLKGKLASFLDEDYILPSGDPVAIGVATAIAARVNGGRVTLLKWERHERKYYPVKVDLTEVM